MAVADRGTVAGRAGEKYGPWKTLHKRLRVSTKDSTWELILAYVLAYVIVKDDSIGTVEWTFSVHSTNVGAHQHAAGARKRGLHDRVGRGPRGR